MNIEAWPAIAAKRFVFLGFSQVFLRFSPECLARRQRITLVLVVLVVVVVAAAVAIRAVILERHVFHCLGGFRADCWSCFLVAFDRGQKPLILFFLFFCLVAPCFSLEG